MQAREELEYLVERPRIIAAVVIGGSRQQVFTHVEIGKNLPPLGHQADPELRDPVGRLAADADAIKPNFTVSTLQGTHDRTNRRGLTHAVTADQRGDLSLIAAQTHAEQRLNRAVESFYILKFKHDRHRGKPSALRGCCEYRQRCR